MDASVFNAASQRAGISIFALLCERLDNRLAPIRCSKLTMVDVSHTIEDTILAHRLPALLLTGFEEAKYWKKEVNRYLKLSAFAQLVCTF